MVLSTKKFASLYFILLLVCIYFPTFKVFDKATAQYFFISILNLVSLSLIPIYLKDINLKKYFIHPILLIYLIYTIISILSMIKSINVIESLVKIGQIITILVPILIIIILVQKKLFSTDLILILISLSIIIDIAFSLRGFIPFLTNNIEYSYDQNVRLVGLYGNRNILATILCFKIPFLIMLALRKRSKIISYIAFIVTTIAFYNITLLSSRATYLSILLCLIFLFIVLLLTIKKHKSSKTNNIKTFLFFILPLILSLIMSNLTIDSKDEGAVINRVSSISSTDDVSKNTRLRYYSHAILHTIKNPVLGGGIGNWKIISIKYDAENISNYIIPYNAHNDFLEAFAETGIIGGVSFLAFFLYLFYLLIKNLVVRINSNDEIIFSVFLFLPFIIYFVDLNLNFPSSRPSNQVLMLLYIGIILSTQLKLDDKK